MEQDVFFTFSMIVEGATENVLQFKMPVESIYNKNLEVVEQKMFLLNTTERQRGSNNKKSIN